MIILPLASKEADLERAGGKGANLARLARADFLVPPGFIITTLAYQTFVEVNHLAETIGSAIRDLGGDDASGLETASSHIREAFSAGKVPQQLEDDVRRAYAELGKAPVAVRSSATAEDLPDLSFAGQQDTYLNVLGEDALLKAVVSCWGSLWTARAIGYRIRNGIDQDDVSLAVVVQEMVQSDVSGVLFTANPLTGLLSEAVIDATFGLGEALVSGQVEPDHFVVNVLKGEIVSKRLGEKKLSTRARTGGGVETVVKQNQGRPTLSDSQIRQLASLGQRIQQEFGGPQDIEWAYSGDRLYVLQSRPITSLFPVPEISFDPLSAWISFGAVQGLMTPVTPLGLDAIRTIVAGSGILFGLQQKPEEVTVFVAAGERIWVKISDAIRHPLGSRIYGSLLEYVDPSAKQILELVAEDPAMGAGRGKLKISTLARLLRFVLPVLLRLVASMLRPAKRRAQMETKIEAYLATAQIAPAADRHGRLANCVTYMRERLADAFPFALPIFIPVIGPSMASLALLYKISGENQDLVLEVTRGLPGNVTTQMDLELWQTATEIRSDSEATSLFLASAASTLAQSYLNGELPAAAQIPIARFMDNYGMRGVGEIDIGQPRWREEPTPILHSLQSYLAIEAEYAPDIQFSRGEQAAQIAIEELAAQARQQPAGRLKEKLVRAAARRIRLLMGIRESPKFFIIRTMGIVREALLEVGQEFVDAGTITHPDDLVFLRLSELEALSQEQKRDWKALITERRAIYQKEMRRQQIPRVLVSDGRAFYEGLGAEAGADADIIGSPVSPGTVEGKVRVVLDPKQAQLAPGEILVCPGTDPAWTPLLMAAGGLITEVGGMMTHGSVVAREYGIPAVVGVHKATERLKSGQKIRLNGTAGRIVVLS